jgi:hypothetical protein
VLQCRRRVFAPNTVHGYAQLKTLCRLGHRLGYIPDDITTGFEMPRVPKTIVPTFSDEQLHELLAVPGPTDLGGHPRQGDPPRPS